MSAISGDFSSSTSGFYSIGQSCSYSESKFDVSNSFLDCRKYSICLSPSKNCQYFSLSGTSGLCLTWVVHCFLSEGVRQVLAVKANLN